MIRINKNTTIPDAIPSTYSDKVIAGKFTELLETELMRTKIKNVITEYIDSVPFCRKIKEYANEEIEAEIFRSLKFWISTVIIPIAVAIVTTIILKQYIK